MKIAVISDIHGNFDALEAVMEDIKTQGCEKIFVNAQTQAEGFYKKCGFREHHRVKNFFTDNYDHPIFECGAQLVDMIYLRKEIKEL
mgnify:CR=1 FL=1